MSRLTSLQWWILFPLCLVGAATIAVTMRFIVRRTQRDTGDDPVRHAGPLMPTLGALFAFLSAFVIATEWGAQTQAKADVQHVAQASSRLAWAATAPGVDTAGIQLSLDAELRSMSSRGWEDFANGTAQSAVTTEEFRTVESTTRRAAYSTTVSTPASNELLAAVDDLAAGRRQLAAMAERSLPSLLFLALGLSGFALIANAVTLTIRSHRRTTFIVGSVVVLVAVDLAILLVLAAPFRGSSTISPEPLRHVAGQISSGWFHL